MIRSTAIILQSLNAMADQKFSRRGKFSANVNRMATVGQLSASIAHEVRQPLAGMLANAQAALRWLEKTNVEEVRQSLNGIVSEGFRASEIITNLRAMFKHDVQEKTLVDINKLVSSVLAATR
jgi:C4-dicarboxylate-specific signal transduction histidine kinase